MPLRVVVLGYLVKGPLAGPVWHTVHFGVGLQKLGHDVLLLEDSEDFAACYNPMTGGISTDPSYGLGYAQRVLTETGFGDAWAYFDNHTNTWHGPRGGSARRFCADADVLLNVSGVNPMRPWLESIPVRVFIDTDPGFVQIRHLQDRGKRELAEAHNRFFSIGENIGQAACGIPDDGFPWQTTRHPIVMDYWPLQAPRSSGRFTTVMLWRSYRVGFHGGLRYGQKAESFEEYIELPKRTAAELELAVGGDGVPEARLEASGWHLRNPLEVSLDPWDYRSYMSESRGEFTVAKEGYVVSRSGWFSERSASYLALGRPVITQDTGFDAWLPEGLGVLSFSSPEEAMAKIDAVLTAYPAHCRAARDLAEEYFSHDRVLTSLLDAAATGAADGDRPRAADPTEAAASSETTSPQALPES